MATSTPNVNYDDKRFTQVETDKQAALSEVEKTYGGMVDNVDKFYQAQIDATNQWADKQSQLQQERTDFAIEQINQQKDLAKKDYTKEQSGSYADWQKQSNQYGVNAEQMAANGLTNTGFSESSQVAMYNTYQNRVATAREVYNKAVLNYDNAIKDAQLQNNSALAEIAFNALQKGLELSLEGFQYKNTLLIEQANKKMEVDNMYYGRYQDVLQQINQENALAEEIRQYNEQMAEEKRQYDLNYAMKEKEYEEGIRQFNEEIARLKEQDKADNEYRIAQLDQQKKELEYKQAQLAEEQRQFNLKNTLTGDSYNGSPLIEKDTPEEEEIKTPTGSEVVSDALDSNLTVDMESVLKLGLGITTAEQLEKYIEQGVVQRYVEGNKIKFRYVGAPNAYNSFLLGGIKPPTTNKPTTITGTKKTGGGGGNKKNLAKFEDIATGLK